MKTNKRIRGHQWLFLAVAFAVALISVGCTSNGVSSGGNTNPLGAYQPITQTGTGTSTGVIDGNVTGPGAITSPIVSVPDNGSSVGGHSNAPLLDNYHPGWQQSSCLSCHSETSKNPDHSYADDSLCYLCHGTNGLPGFGDTTPPIISGVAVAPLENSVNAQWKTDEDCVSRFIIRTALGDRMEFPVSTTYKNSHSFSVSGLQADTTYYYEIICVDKSNNSSSTSSFGNMSFQTLPASEIIPPTTDTGTGTETETTSFFSNVSVKSGGPFRIDVKFNVSEACTCTVYFVRKANGTLADSQNMYVASAYDGFVTGFAANTEYVVYVEAKTNGGQEYSTKKYNVKTDKY
ncbi:MAG: hypothetical protein PHF08_00605 [Candidatus Riflebacteria bacterium]|nr:hypothetical protein [Candidatus Riflebacteria bacterium]